MKATKAEQNRTRQAERSEKFGSEFTANFRRLRHERGETLRDIAAAVGAGLGTVQAWDNGSVPHAPRLKRLADHFGVPVIALTQRSVLSGSCVAGEPEARSVAEARAEPTRAEIESRLKKFLDVAEKVPGGLGYASVQVALHLRPEQIRELDPAAQETKRRGQATFSALKENRPPGPGAEREAS